MQAEQPAPAVRLQPCDLGRLAWAAKHKGWKEEHYGARLIEATTQLCGYPAGMKNTAVCKLEYARLELLVSTLRGSPAKLAEVHRLLECATHERASSSFKLFAKCIKDWLDTDFKAALAPGEEEGRAICRRAVAAEALSRSSLGSPCQCASSTALHLQEPATTRARRRHRLKVASGGNAHRPLPLLTRHGRLRPAAAQPASPCGRRAAAQRRTQAHRTLGWQPRRWGTQVRCKVSARSKPCCKRRLVLQAHCNKRTRLPTPQAAPRPSP